MLYSSKSRFVYFTSLILFSITLVFFNCRRHEDIQFDKVTHRFFYLPSNTSNIVKNIAQSIYVQNQQNSFVRDLVRRVGYPVWNKVIINGSGSNSSYRNTGGGVDFIFIPFTNDNGTMVNSALVVEMTASDTLYSMLYPQEFPNFGFSYVDTSKTSARDVFLLFARFQNLIYGTKEYWIKDNRLFGGGSRPPSKANVQFNDPTNCINCSVFQMEWWEICFTYSGSNCNCPAEWDQCDLCSICAVTQCWSGWTFGGGGGGDDGWGYEPEGSTGGGGSGQTSNWWSDPCEEDAGGGRVEPCGTLSEWSPILDTSDVLNDSIIGQRLKRLYQKAGGMPDSLFQAALQDDTERTFTFVTSISGSISDTVPMWAKSGTSLSSSPTLTANSIAIWHTHQDDGPTDPYKNQSFDGPDHFKLFKNRIIDGYPIQVSFITTRDYVYAVIITNPIKFQSYITTLAGTNILTRIEEKLNNAHIDAMDLCTACSFQAKTEKGILAITANNNSEISGVKVFRSPRNNLNFTLLSP